MDGRNSIRDTLLTRKYGLKVMIPVFQIGDTGSIPVTCSILKTEKIFRKAVDNYGQFKFICSD